MIPRILVTGGAGFIGSEFVRQAVQRECHMSMVDKLTYAADMSRLMDLKNKYSFYKTDICSRFGMERAFSKGKPEIVINFAAETHVDRSIVDSGPFLETNIKGVKNLLDLSRKYGVKKIIHVSTDEVYGDIIDGSFYEDSPIKPNSPYAASKASADLLIKSYIRTYGVPAIILRPSNNYGPWQYPEKLIPLAILRALEDKPIPVYASGKNIREWLYVSDCIEAVFSVIEHGQPGQVYNIGSAQEKMNIDVVKGILKILGKSESLIEFVKDRPGHDLRYSLDSSKIKDDLGWSAKTRFEDGLRRTVDWFASNRKWLDKHSRKNLSIKFK